MTRMKLTAKNNLQPDWMVKLNYFLMWPFAWLLIPFARVVRTYEFEV